MTKGLDDFAMRTKRLRAALNESAIGPLEIAKEVVAIAEDWEKWRAKAGGVDFPEWLRELHPEHRLSWYRDRARALDILGPVAKEVHHEGAVMIARQVPTPYLDKVRGLVHELYKDNGRVYVTQMQARKAVAAALCRVETEKQTRMCKSCIELEARIKRLEAQVKRLGEEPVK